MITLADDSWYRLTEDISGKIERAIRAGKTQEAFKWLHVMDLLDAECAAYWRERGWGLYSGEIQAPQSHANPILDGGGLVMAELAYKPEPSTADLFFGGMA